MSHSKHPITQCASHVFVSGNVQGVGYRYALTDFAQALGLTGWCRNLPDGRVEAWLQGSQDTVNQALDWLYQGPPAANVTHVEILPGTQPDSACNKFEIRR